MTEKQEDGKLSIKMTEEGFHRITKIAITLKGDNQNSPDLRITYSLKEKWSKYGDYTRDYYGHCKIEKVRPIMFGLFEKKKLLFKYKDYLDSSTPSSDFDATLNKRNLDRIMRNVEPSKNPAEYGMYGIDENLAKVEKQVRELAASKLEIIAAERRERERLIEIREKQIQAENAKKQEEIAKANLFKQEEYQTALDRITTKIAPKEEQTPKENSSNSPNHYDNNIPTMQSLHISKKEKSGERE